MTIKPRIAADGTVILDSPNQEGEINELYAWVSVDENGEGIIASNIPMMGGWTPLITSRPHVAAKMQPMAIKHVNLTDKKVRLIKFIGREVVKEVS